jgi:hypothetical protein
MEGRGGGEALVADQKNWLQGSMLLSQFSEIFDNFWWKILALFWVKNTIFCRFFRRKYLKNHNIGPRVLCWYLVARLENKVRDFEVSDGLEADGGRGRVHASQVDAHGQAVALGPILWNRFGRKLRTKLTRSNLGVQLQP